MSFNLQAINIAVERELIDFETAKKKGWEWYQFGKFQQDDLGYKDEQTGEEFPPTFNYKGTIQAMRKDKQFFYVGMCVFKEEMEQEDIEKLMCLLKEDVDNATELLDSFLSCECRINQKTNETFTCAAHENLIS
jgi:hypothetical protein